MDQTARKDIGMSPIMREHNIRGKKYVIKSVFIGNQDIKTTLLKLAERKAIREMGIDSDV